MAETSMHQLRLVLGNLDELFGAPAFDPLGGRLEEAPGLDRLANELRPLRRAPVSTRIVPSATEHAPDLEARCRKALQAVLDRRIERFIDEGLVIAGWVARWYPLDVLLYQRWPLARERRLYENLREMRLEFEFRD